MHAPIEEGKRFIEHLADKGFPYQNAYWMFNEERCHWQLIIVTDIYDKQGPLETYRQLTGIYRTGAVNIDIDCLVARTESIPLDVPKDEYLGDVFIGTRYMKAAYFYS
jgi:hypothetical protein